MPGRAALFRDPVRSPRRAIIINTPPICGINASSMNRSMAKASGDGRNVPREVQAISLMAASV
jgi:hypothetical protein